MNNIVDTNKKWKLLFLSLVSINVGFIAMICLLLFIPGATVEIPEKTPIENERGAQFLVQSSKQNVSELVNGYLDKLLNEDGGNYVVYFENDVELVGSIEAFQTKIPLSIHLEPIVQENGDLILQQKEISLGLLHLPNEAVLHYLKMHLMTPDWVMINPSEENIYVALTQMEVKSNFLIKVLEFDLENDNISFQIEIPNETLGL